MKLGFLPYVICLFLAANLWGQGTVNFSNAGGGRVTDARTGLPLPVGSNYVVHLFYAPITVPPEEIEAAMISLLPSTVIRPVPGAFFGGTRTTPETTPGGAPAYFQVRVWDTSLGATWEQALAAWRQDISGAKLLGKSEVILVQQTGNPSTIPPGIPAHLVAAGLRGFSVYPYRNEAPRAAASIQPLAQLPGSTDRLVISGNNSDALIALDGSASSDPIDGIASYSWFLASASEPFALGPTAFTRFGLGEHAIRLVVVDNGGLSDDATLVFDVITAAEAITSLMVYLQAQSLPNARLEPLVRRLSHAAGFFQDGKVDRGLHQLGVFQTQLRRPEEQIPESAAAVLNAAAQTIIDNVQFQRANQP